MVANSSKSTLKGIHGPLTWSCSLLTPIDRRHPKAIQPLLVPYFQESQKLVLHRCWSFFKENYEVYIFKNPECHIDASN